MLKIEENINAKSSILDNCVVILKNGRAGEFAPVHYLVETHEIFVSQMNAIQNEMNEVGIRLTSDQVKTAWLRWLEAGNLGRASSVVSQIDEERYERIFGKSFTSINAILRNVREGRAK